VAGIVAALNPRPVLLEKFVDGRNIIAHHASWRASSRLVVRDTERPPELVSWLTSQFPHEAK